MNLFGEYVLLFYGEEVSFFFSGGAKSESKAVVFASKKIV